MTNEHSGISRRGLMRAAAVGVPAASLLAFGSDSGDRNKCECG